MWKSTYELNTLNLTLAPLKSRLGGEDVGAITSSGS